MNSNDAYILDRLAPVLTSIRGAVVRGDQVQALLQLSDLIEDIEVLHACLEAGAIGREFGAHAIHQ